jgi:NADH-quinone oxidoreductase subunit C
MGTEPPEKQPPTAPEGGETKPAGAASGEPAKPAAPAAPATPAAPAASKPAAAAPPKPPAPKKEERAPLDNDLVKRFRARFGEAVREAWLDRKQAILVVEAAKLRAVCEFARDSEKFDMLADLTAVDWPKREKRFEVVLQLYSFPKNERLRVKAAVADGEAVPSVTSVWPTAGWLERECFDMFGIPFEGHPGIKRILLPDEWQGHPLRKDYDILQQDEAWVRENMGIESGQ